MKTFLSLLVLSLFLLPYLTQAQTSAFYPSNYHPSKPFGGEDEIKRFVKQEMVYPEIARDQKLEGSIFINFIVDNSGHIAYKEIVDNGIEVLGREAEFIFDRIAWLPRNSEETNEKIEKIRIDFNLKKYMKLVKKRGYDKLPLTDLSVSTDYRYYSINQVDVKPELKDYESMKDFIRTNFKYPDVAFQRGISGRVVVEFIIEPYGKASNIRIKEALAGGCNDEVKRLVQLMNWVPSMKDNEAVRTLYEYQLNFVHPGGTVNGSY